MTSEDPNLKDMYRRASRETSPAHLDRRILAQATPNRLWQPFALAATVLLSFAFIMNIGLLQPDAPVGAAGPSMENSLKEETVSASPSLAQSEDSARQAPPPQESQSAAKRAFAPRSSTMPASPESAADLGRAMDELRENDQDSGNASAFSQTAIRALQGQPRRYCSEAASASAGSWYRCILELREENLEDEANFEQTLLLSKYPDFEIR